MDTRHRFVTVDCDGRPHGHQTATEALDALMTHVGGSWHLLRHTRDAAARDLAENGFHQFAHSKGVFMAPILAAVFDNWNEYSLLWYTNRHIALECRTREPFALARRAWKARELDGPRVGDLVLHPDGTNTRFTNKTGRGLQAGGGLNGHFAISDGGSVSYSGGLTGVIPLARIERTPEHAFHKFNMWYQGVPGASRLVNVQLETRVYRELPK